MFSFNSIQHAMASFAQEAHKAGVVAEGVVAKVAEGLKKAGAAEPIIEAAGGVLVTAATGSTGLGLSSEELLRAAFQALGIVSAAASDASAAAQQNGANILLDAQTLADFRTLGSNLAATVKAAGISFPAKK